MRVGSLSLWWLRYDCGDCDGSNCSFDCNECDDSKKNAGERARTTKDPATFRATSLCMGPNSYFVVLKLPRLGGKHKLQAPRRSSSCLQAERELGAKTLAFVGVRERGDRCVRVVALCYCGDLYIE